MKVLLRALKGAGVMALFICCYGGFWSVFAIVFSILASAAATVYTGKKQEKAAEDTGAAQRAVAAQAEARQRELMGTAKTEAEKKQEELAKEKAALEAQVKGKETQKQSLLDTRKETLRRGRSALVQSSSSVWETAAPVFKPTLANPYASDKKVLLGG